MPFSNRLDEFAGVACTIAHIVSLSRPRPARSRAFEPHDALFDRWADHETAPSDLDRPKLAGQDESIGNGSPDSEDSGSLLDADRDGNRCTQGGRRVVSVRHNSFLRKRPQNGGCRTGLPQPFLRTPPVSPPTLPQPDSSWHEEVLALRRQLVIEREIGPEPLVVHTCSCVRPARDGRLVGGVRQRSRQLPPIIFPRQTSMHAVVIDDPPGRENQRPAMHASLTRGLRCPQDMRATLNAISPSSRRPPGRRRCRRRHPAATGVQPRPTSRVVPRSTSERCREVGRSSDQPLPPRVRTRERSKPGEPPSGIFVTL